MKNIIMVICIVLLCGCASQEMIPVSFTEKEEISFEKYVIPYSFFPRTIELVGLGDSLTQGVGDELKREGYIGRFEKEVLQFNGIEDVVITNTAKRGRRSDQLLKTLQSGDMDHQLRNADIITLTIGGNDMMKIVKKNLFNLKVESFEKELISFEKNYKNIIAGIQEINSDAIIVLIGIYNPFSIVTDEKNEFDTIVLDWNNTIGKIANEDKHACFIEVDQLFDSNDNLVYHTDFFHPNSKGYQLITESIMNSLQDCGFIDQQKRELLF